jgi:hypothetical protein
VATSPLGIEGIHSKLWGNRTRRGELLSYLIEYPQAALKAKEVGLLVVLGIRRRLS